MPTCLELNTCAISVLNKKHKMEPMEVEASVSPLVDCETQFDMFANRFQERKEFLSDQLKYIESDTQHIQAAYTVIAPGCLPSDETYSLIEALASDIQTRTSSIESTFNYYRQRPEHVTSPEEPPQFLQWLNTIFSLQQLFWKQDQNVGDEQIALCRIQRQVLVTLNHLQFLHNTLNKALQLLRTAKAYTQGIFQQAEAYPSLQSLARMDFSQILSMEQPILELVKTIYEKHSVIIIKQPRVVIMKSKKGSCGTDRDVFNRTTRTDIAVKLLNLGYANSPVSVKMGLINENIAEEIQTLGLKQPLEFQTEIYSHCTGSSRADDTITSHVQNFEKYIETGLQAEEIAHETERGTVFGAKTENISVHSVGKRNRKSSSGEQLRVIKEKFYFLIYAELQASFNEVSVPITAWALTTPMIVRTYSSHIAGAYATSSWNKYFSENTGIPCKLRSEASKDEIKNVLQQHFAEWTTCKPKKGKIESLSLDESQLEFLMDMLLDDISTKLGMSKEEIANKIPLDYFYYGKLQGRNFSFISWFYKSTELLKRIKYFRKLWTDGFIKGFIGTDAAFALLRENGCKVGNFLLKFSQGEEGKLTAAFVDASRELKLVRLPIDKGSEKSFKKTFLQSLYNHEIWQDSTRQHALATLYKSPQCPDVPKRTAFPEDQNHLVRGYVSVINVIQSWPRRYVSVNSRLILPSRQT